jgi:hypothetical protein
MVALVLNDEARDKRIKLEGKKKMLRKILSLLIIFTLIAPAGVVYGQYPSRSRAGVEYIFGGGSGPSQDTPNTAVQPPSQPNTTPSNPTTQTSALGQAIQRANEHWRVKAEQERARYKRYDRKIQELQGEPEPKKLGLTRGYWGSERNPGGFKPETDELNAILKQGTYSPSRIVTYDSDGDKWQFVFRDDPWPNPDEWTVYLNGKQITNSTISSFSNFKKYYGKYFTEERWWYIDYRIRQGGKDGDIGSHPHLFRWFLSDAIRKCRITDGDLGD